MSAKNTTKQATTTTADVAKKPQESLLQKIQRFDWLVTAQRHEDSAALLADILNLLENGKATFGAGVFDTRAHVETHATIFCAAVTRLLSDKTYNIKVKTFLSIAHMKRALMQAFEISGYRGTGHFVQMVGTLNEKGERILTKVEVAKLLLGLSINALTPDLLALLKRQSGSVSWPLLVGFLSEQIVWSKQGKQARAELLKWADHYIDMPTSYDMVRNIGPAYMGCSYDEAAHKHDIKRAMNSLVRRWLVSCGVVDAAIVEPRRAVKKRPTIVIMAELYEPHHAMHRCYGPSIRSLKEKFKTIYVPMTGKCAPEIADMFDKVDLIGFTPANPKPFLDKIKSYRPDILYMPSVGMRFGSIVTSNVRLAPIQIYTPGHPATTRSDKMDYLILMEGCFRSADCYSEKVVLRDSKPYFEMRKDATAIAPKINENPQTIKVAVPAWSRKVTPGFLEACKRIAALSKKDVEFHFFPNGVGALYQAFGRRLDEALGAKVYPRTDYNSYIAKLNECDLFLSTFPFGATNSIVDATIQGLPVVNMMGDEAHAMNDSDMLKFVQKVAWLNTNNVEEFIAASVRLIDSDEERVAISRSILEKDPARHFLAANAESMTDFASIFMALYKNHDAIQHDSERVWHHDKLLSM